MQQTIDQLRERLRSGLVIPAHPLALTSSRRLDERHQRALTRYYRDAGAGGVAVGVHTTQFAIRKAGLLLPVLELAREQLRGTEMVAVAGVCGQREQALQEARLAADLGYDCALVTLAGLDDHSVDELILHVTAVGEILPVFGFYLQPAVGGRLLPFTFWRRLAEVHSLVAIKIAPFNRYQTLEVVRAVVESGRQQEIALYTGNDDNIVADLLTPFCFAQGCVRMVGGLLGHWAVWTRRAVELLNRIKTGAPAVELLALGLAITDVNAALFDAANGFRGCIAGIHEILRRQGLMAGRWLLDPNEDLSAGQMQEIERVCQAYPQLNDDEFVAAHLDDWLS